MQAKSFFIPFSRVASRAARVRHFDFIGFFLYGLSVFISYGKLFLCCKKTSMRNLAYCFWTLCVFLWIT